MKAQLPKYLAGIIFLASILIIQWIPRNDFWMLSSVYLASFVAYIILIIQFRDDSRFLLLIGGVTLLSFFWSTPQLSEDIYRFLWDGRLWRLGINPFGQTPLEVTSTDRYLAELYPHMTELTKGNHTCYPGLNQLYFFIAALPTKISHSILLLRLLFIVSIIPGLFLLQKLLKELNLAPAGIWLLTLNPLFLIETFGNLHFEGVMMSFLIIAFYYLKRFFWLSGIFFALAVQIKLIPLIALPFLIRYIGLKKSALFGIFVLTLNTISSMIIMDSTEFMNFLQSIRLYFGIFEFNSFIPHYVQQTIKFFTGFDPIRYSSPIFSVITMGVLLFLSLYRKKESKLHLFQDLSLGILLYFLLNSIVHPWYLIVLVFFLPFVQKRTIILWSLVSILSYGYYSLDPTSARLLINFEYMVVLISLILELRSRMFNRLDDHAFQEQDRDHSLPMDGRI